MDETSTKKLLLYLFNETEMTDSVMIQHDIDYNYYVAEEFKNMKESLGYLDEMLVEPSKRSVNQILDYSKSCMFK